MNRSLLEKRLSLRSDFIITGVNGIGTVLGIFVVSGYLARTLGLDALGEYLLVRRTVTSSLGVLLFGLNVALPALIAKNEERGFGDAAVAIFALGTVPLIFLIAAIANFDFLTLRITPSYILFTTGFCLLTVAYALYRGHLNMVGANLLQLIAGTVVSIVAAYLASSVDQLLLMIGLGMMVISGFAFLHRNRGFHITRITGRETTTLLKFGLVRVPGLLFQFFLLAGAPLLAFSYISLTDQAFLNAGISLVRSFLMVVGPLGIVLLPRVSSGMSAGKNERLRANLSLLVKATLYHAAVIGLALSYLSGEILDLWLGGVTEKGIAASEILLLSVPFFVICVVLRSPIDGGSERGYNSGIYGVGVAVMIGVFLMKIWTDSDPLMAAAWAFLGGYIVAGVGSLLIGEKLFKLKVLTGRYVISLAIALLSVLILFWLNPWTGVWKLSIFFGSVIMLSLLQFFFSKEKWVVALREILGRKPSM
ncbi:MAG: hypothetical protein VX822_05905 [Candidatus Neomarinimicrobiota bacterium]|nr:hypothetical protein [Candidatus Neomarinimicrobiota bacterium]